MLSIYALVAFLLGADERIAERPAHSDVGDALEAERAMETGSNLAPPTGLTVSVNGYGDMRWSFAAIRTDTLAPSDDLPVVSNLTEANMQLRLGWARGLAIADASFFYQMGTVYYANVDGQSVRVADHDVRSYRPLALINEIYSAYNFTDWLNITVGKKRIVWGPGLVVNPTDLLNPPKDPTDPAFQRTGAWLLRLEAPLERVTFTALFAGAELREYGGVPAGLFAYPSYPTYEHTIAPGAFADDRDRYAHFAAIARIYALVADTDINLLYYFTNRYNDAFAYKSRLGVSAQRFVWGTLELHAEAQGQLGSAREYVNTLCFNNPSLLAQCAAQGQLLQTSQINDHKVNARVLAGGSYTFSDDAQLTVEYLYDSTGYDDAQFAAYAQLLGVVQAASRAGESVTLPSLAPVDPGSPQKFTFSNMRQHYLFFTYVKPHVSDDWTLTAVLMLDAHDMSGLLSPSVTWSVRDWLNLSMYGFLPWSGPDSLRTQTAVGAVSEFGILPMDARLMVSARAFY